MAAPATPGGGVPMQGAADNPTFGEFDYDPSNPVEVANKMAKLEAELAKTKTALATVDITKKMAKTTIKVPLPDSFSGETVGKDGLPVSIRQWRADIFSYLKLEGCAKNLRVSYAKRFLTGHARNAYQSHESMAKMTVLPSGKKVDVNKWSFFLKATNQLFGHTDEEQVARDHLNELVQTTSAEKYLQEFQGYVAQIKQFPLSEGDLMDRFKRGLKPSLRALVVFDPSTGKQWDTFAKFAAYACRVDGQLAVEIPSVSLNAMDAQDASRQQRGKTPAKRGRSPDALGQLLELATMLKKSKGFHQQGKKGKPAAKGQKRNGPVTKSQCWKDRLCFVCKKSGHQAKNCPDKPLN